VLSDQKHEAGKRVIIATHEERPDAGRDKVVNEHCIPCYTAPGAFRNRVSTGLSTWRCGRRTNEVLCDP
jgi:hypothetical protein